MRTPGRSCRSASRGARAQVIHILEQTRPDQTRGIAEITAALKGNAHHAQFRDVQLQNAVAQALVAATITSDMPTEALFARLGSSTMSQEAIATATEFAMGYFQTIDKFAGAGKSLSVDGVRIPHLFPGTKLDIMAPRKGGPLASEAEQSLLRYIAATTGVSYEQLSRDFTQTNYSGFKGALSETWKFMGARKKAVADRFATIIYRLWLEEMVNKGGLRTFPKEKAGLLYTSGVLNLGFEALSRCDWIGASRGQMDELKETQAADPARQ
jgi:lambda family phage portal protein